MNTAEAGAIHESGKQQASNALGRSKPRTGVVGGPGRRGRMRMEACCVDAALSLRPSVGVSARALRDTVCRPVLGLLAAGVAGYLGAVRRAMAAASGVPTEHKQPRASEAARVG